MSDEAFANLRDDPEVTEKDRAAAVALWEECFGTTFYHEETLGSPHLAALFKIAFARHRQQSADYWYRQGKDDGVQMERQNIVGWLREQDGHGYDSMRADCIEAGEHFTSVASHPATSSPVVDHETGNMSDNDLIERVAQTLGIALARDVERDVYASETCIEERRCIAASLLPIIKDDRAALVAEIVAWLREDDFTMTADEIEQKWGK